MTYKNAKKKKVNEREVECEEEYALLLKRRNTDFSLTIVYSY